MEDLTPYIAMSSSQKRNLHYRSKNEFGVTFKRERKRNATPKSRTSEVGSN